MPLKSMVLLVIVYVVFVEAGLNVPAIPIVPELAKVTVRVPLALTVRLP